MFDFRILRGQSLRSCIDAYDNVAALPMRRAGSTGGQSNLTRILFSLATIVGVAIAAPASAEYSVTIIQVGPNVIATGSGSLNVSALSAAGVAQATGLIESDAALIGFGNALQDSYIGTTGPPSFGTGASNQIIANSTSGPAVAFTGVVGLVYVPRFYVSGSVLAASTSVFNNQSFASLGLAPGSYIYTWGAGATADRFVVNVGNVVAAAVPEPASWAMMIAGFGAVGGALRRARRVRARIVFTAA